jgi:hypothetical protein
MAPGQVRFGKEVLDTGEMAGRGGINLFGDLLDWAMGSDDGSGPQPHPQPCDTAPPVITRVPPVMGPVVP